MKDLPAATCGFCKTEVPEGALVCTGCGASRAVTTTTMGGLVYVLAPLLAGALSLLASIAAFDREFSTGLLVGVAASIVVHAFVKGVLRRRLFTVKIWVPR